ncbi:MAG TPA: hypothetical protein VNO30_29465 [Kofleriaceae bacterium]|nr:hypothetical protein [Kofleriaceae bacterium]
MTSPHGTRYEEQAGRLTAIIDRTGFAWALLAWDGDRLAELRLPGGVIVDGAIARDPLLGDAHVIRDAPGAAPLTAMSALDWARPAEIPTVAAPGRLPPGAGGALLHAIAVLAARAGVPALRYAGPYPTPALWRALARSFRTAGTEAAFTADLIPRAAQLAREPIAIDFAPAPGERVAFPGGHAELRDGVERAVVDGTAYERGGSPARLVPADGGGARAELWLGDAPYAHVATLGPDGSLVEGPRAIPPCESRVLGAEFPPPLVLALAELVAQAVPAPLAADARAWIAARPVRWADTGARVAAVQDGELCVHAALWERIAPLGLGRLALALAEALAPTATAAVVAAVTAAPPAAPPGH